MLGKHQSEQDRRQEGGANHHQQNRRLQGRGEQAGLGAEAQENQAHLAPGQHPQTHHQAVGFLSADIAPARGHLAHDRHREQEGGHDQALAVFGLHGIEHREIHAGANQHKEDRGKQGHQGLHRGLDGMGVLGAAQDQARRKGAQGRLQANGLGREAAEREHHKRRHHHFARGLEPVEQPIKGRGRRAAQHQRHHHKGRGGRDQFDDRANTEAGAARQGHHHRQDHDAKDVVEHGRANHGLAFPSF